jgi:hypothetical protein
MEPERSLPCSYEATSGPCPEPDDSRPHTQTQALSFLQVFWLKHYTIFLLLICTLDFFLIILIDFITLIMFDEP